MNICYFLCWQFSWQCIFIKKQKECTCSSHVKKKTRSNCNPLNSRKETYGQSTCEFLTENILDNWIKQLFFPQNFSFYSVCNVHSLSALSGHHCNSIGERLLWFPYYCIIFRRFNRTQTTCASYIYTMCVVVFVSHAQRKLVLSQFVYPSTIWEQSSHI